MPTRVVTLSHATGAGGETVGRTVAKDLGFRYIDEEIISLAARKEHIDAAVVADAERRKTFLARLFARLSEIPIMDEAGTGILLDELAVLRSEHLRALIVDAIHETAERGQAVIVSHAASIPLAGRADVLRVLITASADTRAKRIAQDGKRGVSDAVKAIEDSDAGRADYFQRFYGIDRELPTHYDLVINTDTLTAEDAADIIRTAARRRP